MRDLAFEDAFQAARGVARLKARGAVGRCGLTPDDCDDVAGQLLVTFYTRFDRFDGDRASIRTFASRVMDRELTSILRYRLAGRRRHLGEGSPSSDVTGLDAGCLESGAAPPLTERQHFWMDFERALAPLPPALRETALALCWHTPSELSRLPGQTRTVIYRRIRRLREALLTAGIGPNYFASTGGAH
jgi:DNA-directed RNA polymerase specialized sigma24 family protein